MNLKEYSERAIQTALNTNKKDLKYPMLGLFGEIGEVCEVLKKILRDDAGKITDEHKEKLRGELGDVCWYINRICWAHDITFDQIKNENWKYSWYINREIYDLALYMPGVANDLRIESTLEVSIGVENASNKLLNIIYAIANKIDLTLEDILQFNIEKLESRKSRGVLHGSGSNR